MEKIVVGILILVGILFASIAGGFLIGWTVDDEDGGPAIAVLKIDGIITRDPYVRGFNVDKEIEMLQRRLSDPNVVAVVLDIDSPGGTVVATNMMMRAINSSDKPVVAWIGGSGTSGSYYIASEADYIVSDPLSITGAIGVTTQIISGEELIEKLGLRFETFTSGDMKSIGSFHKNMTDSEREVMQSIVDEIHEELFSGVVEKRNLTKSQIEEIESGRIVLGKQALELGLVDRLGGIEIAIEEAAIMANKTEYRVEHIQRDEGMFDFLKRFSRFGAEGFGEGFARAWIGYATAQSKLF